MSEPKARRVRVLYGVHVGRVGTIIEPDTDRLAMIPQSIRDAQAGATFAITGTGRPGWIAVHLDAEDGQVARGPGALAAGGRGGCNVVLLETDVVPINETKET